MSVFLVPVEVEQDMKIRPDVNIPKTKDVRIFFFIITSTLKLFYNYKKS
jgi:hypothetical protein